MPTQTFCLELLHKLVILSPEDLRDVEEQVKQADESTLGQFIETVKGVLAQQTELIEKMVQIDPEFPAKFATFLHGRIESLQQSTLAADATQLDSIETQISQN